MEIVVPEEFAHLWVESTERPVIKYPSDVLRKIAKPIVKVSKETRELILRMENIMRLANGVGLAAPQIGVPERIIVISPDNKTVVLINPEITKLEGEVVGVEGCLSLPALYGDVKRAAIVEVKAINREGKPVKMRLEGLAARVAQHEIDHLDGVLFIDKVDLATLHWAMPVGNDAE